MRLLEASFEQHYGHEGKDEREVGDVRNEGEEEKTWTVEMGMLATLMIIVAFSEEHYGHEGEDEREVEDVRNEEEEAWTVKWACSRQF